MSSQGRRKWGCWTCRLRRLKCDETRDPCERCTRCGIPCYGYGAKPGWKDGGTREAEKLAAIKAGVAENRRRRALAAKSRNNIDEGVRVSPSSTTSSPPVDDAISSSFNNGEIVDGVSVDEHRHVPFMADSQRPMVDKWPPFSQLPPELAAESANVVQALVQHQVQLYLAGRETELFQHYLNHVFGLQYFHQKCLSQNPSSPHWFFSLLQNILPLQHTVLSLSALHLQCLQDQGKVKATADEKGTLLELQAYRTAALHGLRLYIRDYESVSLTAGYIPILACCSQLLSYDLFQGGVDQWYTHLEAATNLILHRASCSSLITAEETEPDVKEANMFLVGALIWSDVLACASTGRRPMLYHLLPSLIGMSKSQISPIQMENIMGCENQVMLLISEISALQEWKIDSLESRSCSMWSLTTRSRAILDDLEAAIMVLESRLQGSEPDSINEVTHCDNTIITDIITNIFASAAMVYLHVVVCGVQPALPEIRENVERTISAMERIQEPVRGKLARGILWPICVAGSVAETHHQSFFRDFVNKAVDDSTGFGNSRTALGILEASWEAINQEEHQTPSTCSAPLKAKYLLQSWPQIVQKNGHKALLV